ncbi:MAG TPA: hypothetical protein VF127_16045 [Nitrospira sp.]
MPDTSVVEDKGWTVPRILTAERRRLFERCLVVLALTVLPLAAYLLSSVMLEEKGPYWLAENSDPEYAYLLNALNVLEGRPPEHVDHPGTTLQMLGAAVIGLLTMGHSASDLKDLVLEDPEFYLSAINRTMRFLILVSQIAVGAMCLALTQNILLAWLIQFPVVSSAYVLEALGRVAPEPLLLLTGIGLSAALLMMLLRRTTLSESRWSVMLACICGFGVATKLTFIPVLGLALVMLTGLRSRLTFLIWTGIFLLLFTAPIIPRYSALLDWTTNLVMRSGHYGTGESDVISNFWPNLHAVLLYQPSLSWLLAGLVIIVVVVFFQGSTQRSSDRMTRLLPLAAGLVLFHAMQLLVVAKHPGSIAYLMPSIGLSGLTIVVAVMMWKELQMPFPVRAIASGLMLLGLAMTVIAQEHRWAGTMDEYRARRVESAQLEQIRNSQFSECHTVYYYRASSKAYAEYFGAEFSGRQAFGSQIRRQAGPQTLFYQVWSKRMFSSDGAPVDLTQLATRPNTCTVFQGTPFEGEYARFRPALVFTDRCGGTREALYVIGRQCPRPDSSREA